MKDRLLITALLLLASFMLCMKMPSNQNDDALLEDVPADVLAEQVTGMIPVGGDRSSRWPYVREEFAIENPECVACGARQQLNVHHVVPFHEQPELELDKNNLITLCRDHHFRIGHDPDGLAGPEKPNWKKSNPSVREEAAAFRAANRIR